MSETIEELRLVALTEAGDLDGAAKSHVVSIAKAEAAAAAQTVIAQTPTTTDVEKKLDASVFQAYVAQNPGGSPAAGPAPSVAVTDHKNGTATIGAVTVPTIAGNTFTGPAAAAVRSITSGNALDVTAPEFGADPTGATDSTHAIQAAIDKAASNPHGGSVRIPAGTYTVTYPFLRLKGWVDVYGDGLSTRIVATNSTPVPEKTGVFHTGTYNTRAEERTLFRPSVRDMFITTGAANSHTPPIPNICGIVLNTDLGDGPADPDAVPRIENLEIWDTDTGMAIFGRDDQGMKISAVRVRRTLNQGIIVGKPPNHPENLAKVKGWPGGADNNFTMVEVSGANMSGGGNAGIEIYTSQCHFTDCKSWYNSRSRPWQDLYGLTTPALTSAGALAGARVDMGAEVSAGASRNREWMHAGAGFYIRATRTIMQGCEAQENGGHGFMIEWGRNQLMNCLAESSSWHDSVSGAAAPGEAADFYICNDARGSVLSGCRSDNPHETENPGKGSRWGFYVETYIERLRVRDGMCDNHPKDRIACIGKTLRDGVLIDIETIFKSTLERHKVVQQ